MTTTIGTTIATIAPLLNGSLKDELTFGFAVAAVVADAYVDDSDDVDERFFEEEIASVNDSELVRFDSLEDAEIVMLIVEDFAEAGTRPDRTKS